MQKYIFAKHQMHFGIKCIFAPTKCDAKIYFCKASNAFVTFCVTKCDAKIYFCKAYIFQRKMYTKMHLMQKCIFATQRTAEHFPLENVRRNTFLHQIHFCIKCIWCRNAFVTFYYVKCTQRVHFPLENVRFAKIDFCITFCFAEHFPLENVQQNKMLQMHL